MHTIEPIRITKETFAPYGRYYDLRSTQEVQVSEEPLKIGATAVKGGPFFSSSMERHIQSEELLICGEDEMILTVAASNPQEAPHSRDVRAFIMKPGDAAVLARGIWHDANHGVHGDTTYFFLIPHRPFVASEVAWTDIRPEPVRVCWEPAEEEYRGAEQNTGKAAEKAEPVSWGSVIRVLEGPGLPGETGWRSWLETTPGLDRGCCLRIGFAKEEQAGREWVSEEIQQVLCACGSVNITASKEDERAAREFMLQAGDYVRLDPHVSCRADGNGYYYVLSPGKQQGLSKNRDE